jgi:hypothetical protein
MDEKLNQPPTTPARAYVVVLIGLLAAVAIIMGTFAWLAYHGIDC